MYMNGNLFSSKLYLIMYLFTTHINLHFCKCSSLMNWIDYSKFSVLTEVEIQ